MRQAGGHGVEQGTSSATPSRATPPGKSTMTQRMPARPGATSPEPAAATTGAPATGGASPTLEHDLAAAMGFLGGPAATIDASLARADGPVVQMKPDKAGKKKTPKTATKPPEVEPLRFITPTVVIHSDADGYPDGKPPPEPYSREDPKADRDPSYVPTVHVAADQYVPVIDKIEQLQEMKNSKGALVRWYEPQLVKVRAREGDVWLEWWKVAPVDEQADAAHGKDEEGKVDDGFAEQFNREFKHLLHVFDGPITAKRARDLFSPEQIDLFWDFLRAKLYPEGLFNTLEGGSVTVEQRILLSAHILAFSQWPEDGRLRRTQADFCYHWVQLVWWFAGINEAKGGNAGTRGITGPKGAISYGGGKQVGADESGYTMGQRDEDPDLGHHAKAATVENQKSRRESMSRGELESVLKPGDWIFVYNANGSVGGGHSVIFAGWGTTKSRDEAPTWLPAPALEGTDYQEEHDGGRDQIEFAWAYVYSQTNNSPKNNAERGGKLHAQRIGPYYYRQFKVTEKTEKDKKTGVETKKTEEKEANEITPVYSIIRADPESEVPNSIGALLAFGRDDAFKVNLKYITSNGVPMQALRDDLVARDHDTLYSEEIRGSLTETEFTMCDEFLTGAAPTIEHISMLVALGQRLYKRKKDDKITVDGKLTSLRLDLAALGATGKGAKAGAAVDVARIRSIAIEVNARKLRSGDYDPDKLAALIDARNKTKGATSKLDEGGDYAALEEARTSAADPVAALTFAIAQWQLLGGKAVTGYDDLGDVLGKELKKAKVPKQQPTDADIDEH
jgi:hypothetical protein